MADLLTKNPLPQALPTRSTKKRASGSWIIRVLLIGSVIVTVVPLAWMVFIAFQKPRAIITPGWTTEFSLDNFATIFSPDQVYGSQVLYSVTLVVCATAITLLIASFAAYSLSQLNWSKGMVITVLTVSGFLQVIPPMALVPGLFVTLTNYNLNGTLAGLILLNTVFNLPFATIMIKFYFDTLPGELREAASIDGTSDFGTFWRIMLPLAMPGIAAVAIFTGIQVWNEFLFGLVFTTGGAQSPITVGIASLIQPQEIKFGGMAAVGTVTAIPILLLAIVANRQIVAGLTGGAVKG